MWGKREGVLGKYAFCREKVKNTGKKNQRMIRINAELMPFGIGSLQSLCLLARAARVDLVDQCLLVWITVTS